LDATYLLGKKIYVLRIVVNLELLAGRQSRIVDVVNLLIEAITHDQRIGQGESVWFHRVPFLHTAFSLAHTQNRAVGRHYSIMVFADALGEIIGHYRTRMGL